MIKKKENWTPLDSYNRPSVILLVIFLLCLLADIVVEGGKRTGKCRLSSQKRPLGLEKFNSYACAECLFYIYFVAPIGAYAINYRFQSCPNGLLVCPLEQSNHWCNCSNPATVYNLPDYGLNRTAFTGLSRLSVRPGLPPDFLLFTAECCRAAAQCCRRVLSADYRKYYGEKQKKRASEGCPATWDGWKCYSRSLQTGVIRGQCPLYIYGDRSRSRQNDETVNYSQKQCLADGQWFAVNASAQKLEIEWTDYSKCLVRQSYEFKFITGVASFAVSVIAIIPALIIMHTYRVLRNQDVFTLHRNLLLSFLLCGTFYIFNSLFFVIDDGPGERLYLSNHLSCRVLFTVHLRYLRLTTYTWMFSEGFYLLRLLIAAFAEPKSLTPYYIVCWGFPVVPTVLYSGLRMAYDDTGCWVAPSSLAWIDWIIMGPCMFALCTNLIIMVSIMWILIRKLRFSPDQEPAQYRKAVRATLMLLPVFGLHFLLTIYRVPSVYHQVFNLMLDGLQGFFVSLIICYTNGRVLECLRKSWQESKDRRDLQRQKLARQIRYRQSIDVVLSGASGSIQHHNHPPPDTLMALNSINETDRENDDNHNSCEAVDAQSRHQDQENHR